MLLQAYTVLKRGDEDGTIVVGEKPFVIVRIDCHGFLGRDQHLHIVADHDSRNIALYWATQLNESRCTEEQCKAEIEAYR